MIVVVSQEKKHCRHGDPRITGRVLVMSAGIQFPDRGTEDTLNSSLHREIFGMVHQERNVHWMFFHTVCIWVICYIALSTAECINRSIRSLVTVNSTGNT